MPMLNIIFSSFKIQNFFKLNVHYHFPTECPTEEELIATYELQFVPETLSTSTQNENLPTSQEREQPKGT